MQPVPVTVIQYLAGANLFIDGTANGLLKFINADEACVVAELQAHSRQINDLLCDPMRIPSFMTVSDDTFVNVWSCSVQQSSTGDNRLTDI